MRNQSQPIAPVYLVGYPGSPGYPTVYITFRSTANTATVALAHETGIYKATVFW